jgi:hypothetical protein
VLVAVEGEAVLFVLECHTRAAEMLIPLGAVVPELREVTDDGDEVPGQNHVGVGVSEEARSRKLLRGTAATDFVPPLEDADTHATVFDQVHGEKQALVAAPNDHRVVYLVRHPASFCRYRDHPLRCRHSESA